MGHDSTETMFCWVGEIFANSFAQINDFPIRRILRNNIVASVSRISFNRLSIFVFDFVARESYDISDSIVL